MSFGHSNIKNLGGVTLKAEGSKYMGQVVFRLYFHFGFVEENLFLKYLNRAFK